jgi:hypothetical protein
MWKISETRWLNPLAISYVRDNPARQTITVFFTGPGEGSGGPDYEDYRGPERQAVLAFLAQHSHPAVLTVDDDEPPF